MNIGRKRRADLVEKFDEKGWEFKDDKKKKFFQKKQLDRAQKSGGDMNPTMNFKEKKAVKIISNVILNYLFREKKRRDIMI